MVSYTTSYVRALSPRGIDHGANITWTAPGKMASSFYLAHCVSSFTSSKPYSMVAWQMFAMRLRRLFRPWNALVTLKMSQSGGGRDLTPWPAPKDLTLGGGFLEIAKSIFPVLWHLYPVTSCSFPSDLIPTLPQPPFPRCTSDPVFTSICSPLTHSVSKIYFLTSTSKFSRTFHLLP